MDVYEYGSKDLTSYTIDNILHTSAVFDFQQELLFECRVVPSGGSK